MARFTSWIKQAINVVVDPEKGQRVEQLVRTIERDLAAKRQAFVLRDAVHGIEHKPKDLEEATETVYRSMMGRGWQDGKLTQGEQSLARWAAQCLEIPLGRVNEINAEFAKSYFASALAQAMEDGHIDAQEEARLNEIAAAVQQTVPEFARHFFAREAEGFLRGVFAACVAQNSLTQDDWQRLLDTTAKLGVSHNALLCAIEPQARRFVEHVLADAKADEKLSPQEEATLKWLVSNLRMSSSFLVYVTAEIARLRSVTDIAEGKLPSIVPPVNVATRAGEIVHLHSPAIWRQMRMTKNGPRSDDHQGTLMLTDNRLVFSSTTRSDTWNLRKIVTHRGGEDWFELQVQGQAASAFFFPQKDELNYRIFCSAVAMANQTLVRKAESVSTRHIARDVRQRVWQRYGGKCADCGAEEYLEFDHIVPVAKGGSNSDANVQLLCRNCNLKKSDRI